MLKGIEIELLKKYAVWLNIKKHRKVTLYFTQFSDYPSLYARTRLKHRKSFGLTSASIYQQQDSELEFSVPYMKNVSFCVTNISTMEIRQKNSVEIQKAFSGMTALSIANTSFHKYVLALKKDFMPDLKILLVNSEDVIFEELAQNPMTFAYVDGVAFWHYLRANPSKSLKTQKLLSINKGEIAFVLPRGCIHNSLFKEFFLEYKKTAAYNTLLEKYLGTYMAHNVTLN